MAKQYETMQIPVDAEGSLTEQEFQNQVEAYHRDYDDDKGELVMPDFELTDNTSSAGEITKETERKIESFKNKKLGHGALKLMFLR